MKILKVIILVILGVLILLLSFFLFGLLATGHRVPSTTYFWIIFWIILLTISLVFTQYYFNYRDSIIKQQLKKIALSLPNFEGSQEFVWFKEYFQNSKWKLALESIEYFISENNISVNKVIETDIYKLKKKRFL